MDNDSLQAMSWRERLYVIIFFTNTPAGRRFDTWLLVVILASLVVVMFDSVASVNARHGVLLTNLEWAFTAVFAIEYALRIYTHPEPRKYVFSFYGAVDLLSVLPAFVALLFPDAQYLLVVRVVRMLRIFRILKLTPYLSQANFLLVALRGSRQKIIVFLASVTTLVIIYGTLMYVVEGPANGFTSIPVSIYWAVVTLTTVGFGDIVPHTSWGKALATMVMITGYSIIAVPTGIFTAELANAMRQDSLQHSCPVCDKLTHEHHAAYCSRCGSRLFDKPERQAQD
ncbi:ion transporter [Stutzerimonas stutzeri]|uniref:ion transporter n=1 Tax=Stutzerimonas sp. S1 TaxID=3030652 RepID=UPI00222412F2|nr:ion transporter [Stutzerimonas sp. S1]MCW3147889.1 ion transporter [Stutzerimonas sp. S1]